MINSQLINKLLKQCASHLPLLFQQELKRFSFRQQIKKGRFKSDEREFFDLHKWVNPGDWVLDIGANIGHYSARLSEIVGIIGRVIAFEPVPETFELLSANMTRCRLQNVTLLNVAASDTISVVGISVPRCDTGLDNYYMAHLTNEKSQLTVLCMPIDYLNIPERITLAKIDVEGHELSVLKGMKSLLVRDHPILIVEGYSDEVASYLTQFSYHYEEIEGSPNRVFL